MRWSSIPKTKYGLTAITYSAHGTHRLGSISGNATLLSGCSPWTTRTRLSYPLNAMVAGKLELTHWTLGNLNEMLGTILQIISVIDGWGISCELALRWMSLDLTDDKSTLVQVMAWYRQATSRYLSKCWVRFLSPYGVNRSHWVKRLKPIVVKLHETSTHPTH